jgi:hypothetical protein
LQKFTIVIMPTQSAISRNKNLLGDLSFNLVNSYPAEIKSWLEISTIQQERS